MIKNIYIGAVTRILGFKTLQGFGQRKAVTKHG